MDPEALGRGVDPEASGGGVNPEASGGGGHPVASGGGVDPEASRPRSTVGDLELSGAGVGNTTRAGMLFSRSIILTSGEPPETSIRLISYVLDLSMRLADGDVVRTMGNMSGNGILMPVGDSVRFHNGEFGRSTVISLVDMGRSGLRALFVKFSTGGGDGEARLIGVRLPDAQLLADVVSALSERQL